MKDYTYSQTVELKDGNSITFGVSGCHSYDEAIAIVERGVYEYGLKEAKIAADKEALKKEVEKQKADPVEPTTSNKQTTSKK